MKDVDFLYQMLENLKFDEERHSWIESISKAIASILKDKSLTAENRAFIINNLLRAQQYLSETSEANEVAAITARRIGEIEHITVDQVWGKLEC